MKTRKETTWCCESYKNGKGHTCHMTPTHTPTPWKVSQTGKFVMHSKPGTVLNVCEASIEDAAFIVLAVNSFDEMLEALKEAQKIISVARNYFPKSIRHADSFSLENTCAAIGSTIAKAEGK